MEVKKVKAFISENKMLNKGDKVLVALSGGADSVCLFHILLELKNEIGIELEAVHVHHGIRGEEAQRDLEFVEKMCGEEKIKLHIFRYDVPKLAKELAMSEEECGRYLRYKSFEETLEKVKGQKIAIAHNKNDVAETVLLSLARGTDLKGLTGIPAVRDEIIRPILCLEREEIEGYLEKRNISFINDSTNFENDYARNKIRNLVMPVLSEINSRAQEHIANTAKEMQELEAYLEKETKRLFAEIVSIQEEKAAANNRAVNSEGLIIDISKLCKLEGVLQKRLIHMALCQAAGVKKDIGAVHVKEVLGIAKGETGKSVDLPYDLKAFKDYDQLLIKNRAGTTGSLKGNQKNYAKLFRQTKLAYNGEEIEEKLYTKIFDYDKIKGNFCVRTRENGDYINLKAGRKKLKDYFIDMKISRQQRDEILLLAKGSQIIWIVGYRINEEYKVTKNTKQILKIEYIGGNSNGKDI